MDFNKKFTPCLLSRSIPQTLYLPAGRLVFGVKPLIEVLKESVRAFIAPPALRPDNPLYNNPFVSEHICSAMMIKLVYHMLCAHSRLL